MSIYNTHYPYSLQHAVKQSANRTQGRMTMGTHKIRAVDTSGMLAAVRRRMTTTLSCKHKLCNTCVSLLHCALLKAITIYGESWVLVIYCALLTLLSDLLSKHGSAEVSVVLHSIHSHLPPSLPLSPPPPPSSSRLPPCLCRAHLVIGLSVAVVGLIIIFIVILLCCCCCGCISCLDCCCC